MSVSFNPERSRGGWLRCRQPLRLGQFSNDLQQASDAAPFRIKGVGVNSGRHFIAENAPLIAITLIEGKRRRTTESNSKPDMPGMLRSERMISGTSFRISTSAENPSWADRTE